jgi:hypothetical protein
MRGTKRGLRGTREVQEKAMFAEVLFCEHEVLIYGGIGERR